MLAFYGNRYRRMLASFWTGIFATSSVSSLGGFTLAPSGIDGNAIQVGKQFAEIKGISFVLIPGIMCPFAHPQVHPSFYLQVTDESEIMGLDNDKFFDEMIGDWSLQEAMENGSC